MAAGTDKQALIVRRLGRVPYQQAWDAMRSFNTQRSVDTADEIWLLEHPPVYTLGLNNKSAPPANTDIEIIQTDRGGQITYHGPGQLIVYTLLDLQRLGMGVRDLVELLEESVIALLGDDGIAAKRKEGAPGVYVDEQKVAALGLRVRKHGSYHGLSLNIDMDLAPFAQIDPCGYRDMPVVDLHRLGLEKPRKSVEQRLLTFLANELGYTLPSEPFKSELP
ncbi:MAG: lipoyl(octanoyl) transferase LipB [Acidiferrobacterales bacterium]